MITLKNKSSIIIFELGQNVFEFFMNTMLNILLYIYLVKTFVWNDNYCKVLFVFHTNIELSIIIEIKYNKNMIRNIIKMKKVT